MIATDRGICISANESARAQFRSRKRPVTRRRGFPGGHLIGTIRIGVGGWTFAPWRGVFYPPGLPHAKELHFASRQLTSIEINGTFYGTQSPTTFAKWRDETPDGFVFAVKGPRYATNRRVLAEAGDSVARFFASGVAELGEKLGPVNWQFAPTKKFDATDFDAFLALLPRALDGRPIRHAVELRHPSFATREATEIARARDVAIVRAGDSAYPAIEAATTDFVYARIMGTTEDEPTGYPARTLTAWAKRARAWAAEGDVFLYVISGHKALNPAAATALIERLSRM